MVDAGWIIMEAEPSTPEEDKRRKRIVGRREAARRRRGTPSPVQVAAAQSALSARVEADENPGHFYQPMEAFGLEREARRQAKLDRRRKRYAELQARANGRQWPEWPDLYEFYNRQRQYPPITAQEALERFVEIWPPGMKLGPSEVYGNGQLLRFDNRETKEALCQLVGEGKLLVDGRGWRLPGEYPAARPLRKNLKNAALKSASRSAAQSSSAPSAADTPMQDTCPETGTPTVGNAVLSVEEKNESGN